MYSINLPIICIDMISLVQLKTLLAIVNNPVPSLSLWPLRLGEVLILAHDSAAPLSLREDKQTSHNLLH